MARRGARATPREPRHARGAATAEAILAAATELFAARGVEQVSMRAIAERAGVGMGSLYQFFPTRDALLLAWTERLLAEQVVRAGADLAQATSMDTPLVEVVALSVRVAMDVFGRLAEGLGPGSSDEARSRIAVRRALAVPLEALVANLLEHGARPGVVRTLPYPEAARLVIRVVSYVSFECVFNRPEDEPLYLKQLVDMVTRYLAADVESPECVGSPTPPRP